MILAIDPGREKVGTVLYKVGGGIEERNILSLQEFWDYFDSALSRFEIDLVLIGDGTGADFFRNPVENKGIKVCLVPEEKSTEEAKGLYFSENPPRGWKKLVPRGLLSPPEAIDDYAAEVLLLRFLKKYAKKEGI